MLINITRKSAGFRLESTMRIAAGIERVFSFFADAGNLERITPSQLRFKVLTPQPIDMEKGSLIDYQLRLHGIPMRWQSAITAWEPPHRFIDEQRRGPYRRWIYEHRFAGNDQETTVTDVVDYSILGGRLVHSLFVRRDLERIFSSREAKLSEIFPSQIDCPEKEVG
jgi:ligand-binding SRPBCC domain-containing protein